MKRLFITLTILLIINFTASAQSFNKTAYFFGDSTHTHNEILSMVKIGNNYFFNNGIVDSINHVWNSIVKTDSYGNVLDKKLIGDTSFLISTYPGNTIIVDNDSNILLIGHVKHNSTGYWDAYIVKLNQNLDTLWIKIYDLPDSIAGCLSGEYVLNALTSVKQTLDGGYIITGKYYINCINVNANERSYLLKLDTDGNVEWRKVYNNISYTFDIEISLDSGYIFASIPTRGLNLVKTDKYGNQQWIYSLDNNYIHRIGQDINLLNDSIAIVVGQYIYDESTTGNYPNAVDIYKVNINTKQKIWEKRYYLYQNFKCIGLHQSISASILDNMDIIISGTSSVLKLDSTASGYKGIMLKLNSSNGDSIWSRYYHFGSDFREDCQFNDMILTDDGGFLAAGYHKPYVGSYNAGAWLVKMDSMGMAPGAFTVSVKDNQLIITKNQPLLYPNPVSDNFNLRFEENQNGKLQMEIYNVSGQLVMKHQISDFEKEYQVNIDKLSSGIYLVKLASDNQTVYSGKFIKE
ncbi:MAG: T9SS type A sorting domain-containing protein [Saprospiraceae bacterium]|nr:T9SS type A sorting domain-containing protein [Saprospiraceae bacterium]